MRAVLFLLLMCCSAIADEYTAGDDQAPPPARFLGPYNRGALYVYRVDRADVWSVCYRLFTQHGKRKWRDSLDPSGDQRGCAVPHIDKRGIRYSWCKIATSKGDRENFTHEMAHCNGWSERHER